MAATPAPRNTVHWAPSPILSPLADSSSSTSSIPSSASTLQYVNAQLISHGFAVHPGLSLDGLSNADAEAATKCLLSMLSQRVEDMTRAEELTTKLRTLSYDHERLRTMHGAATETAESAEREAAAARAKLTIANRAQTQAEAAHKQMTSELQRARAALQALRATHVAELKRREKENEAMRERWSKLADAQLKIGSLPSRMTVSSSSGLRPANASVLGQQDGAVAAVDGGGGSGAGAATAQKGLGLVEEALEEAEKACAGLREENRELKGLVVDAANAVRKILHKAVSSDPDDLEFPPPFATINLFPLGAPDAACERLSALLTSLRDAVATLRTCETPATSTASGSNPNPQTQISLADLAKKAAQSDAKAHKWEVEELRTTIAGLRDELRKVNAERKSAPASRSQDVPAPPQVQDKLASYLPPNDESCAGPTPEPQEDNKMTNFNSEPDRVEQSPKKRDLLSSKPEKRAPAVAQPGPSRTSPRKTRSKSKGKAVFKSPLKVARASASAKRSGSGSRRSDSRPGRLTTAGKRVLEASFETEVIPSTVPASLLPTSFVIPPPSPESRPPPHPATFLLGPSTTPPFPPPPPHAQPLPPPQASSSSSTERGKTRVGAVVAPEIVPSIAQPLPPPPPPISSTPKSFPSPKPLPRNMSHAYSPAKPSPLSRILMLAESPEGAVAEAGTTHKTASAAPHPPALQLGPNPFHPPGISTAAAAPVFQPHPIPPPISLPTLASVPVPTTHSNQAPRARAPARVPLRTGSTSNAAGPQRRRKRTSREAELDLDADADAYAKGKSNANDARLNPTSVDVGTGNGVGMGMDVDEDTTTRDPRAPEKENTIRRRLKGGPGAVAKTRSRSGAGGSGGSGAGGVKTRKMAAAAKSVRPANSSVPAPAPAPVHAPAPPLAPAPPPEVDVGRVGGAASRLLAVACGGSGLGGGLRRVPTDGAEASAGIPARRVS